MKEIPLTQGKVALVDDADFELVSQYKWQADKSVSAGRVCWYAITTIRRADGSRQKLRMHRHILGITDPHTEVDHVDHDGLHNTHENLRVCGRKTNMGNQRVQNVSKSSRYKGVGWHKSIGKWQAYIKVNQTIQYLGCFSSERLAAFSYNQAAKREFGEFAFLNKIENPPRALLRF